MKDNNLNVLKMCSFDIRCIYISLLMAILFEIPLLIFGIIYHDIVFYILSFILLFVFSLICFLLYITTEKDVLFSINNVCIKNNIETKIFQWHEIQIEYCGADFLPTLEAFTIKIIYFDSEKSSYKSLYIPSSKTSYYKILGISRR